LAKTQAEKKKLGNKSRNRVISDRFLEKALKKFSPVTVEMAAVDGKGAWLRHKLRKTVNKLENKPRNRAVFGHFFINRKLIL
jgi:hypothetical protein